MLAQVQSSRELMQCLINLELPALKSEAKTDLLLRTNELMPKGVPDLLGVVKFPTIQQLATTEGKKKMLAVLVLLVKDFCASVNVVRNMNEDQMFEAAAMLLEESGNFRLEDYVMMFSMAKKGHLLKIYDRLDIQVITSILDEYWKKRNDAGEKAQEQELINIENSVTENPIDRKTLQWNDVKGYVEVATIEDKMISAASAFGEMKAKLLESGLINLD